MIYRIKKEATRIVKESVSKGDIFEEREIECFLVPTTKEDSEMVNLDEDIFEEENLLFLNNQVHIKISVKGSRSQRILDILAIDENGSIVIIELKKSSADIEASTQSLHYISLLNGLTYREVFQITDQSENSTSIADEKNIRLDDKVSSFRIILVAQDFHPSVFSLGEWFGEKGIGFKCIKFNTFRLDAKSGENFIFFKTVFNTYQKGSYKLVQKEASLLQNANIYWYNIALGGNHVQSKWNILLKNNFITAGFKGEKGDKGERLLTSYLRKGMKIIAYASGIGALGVAEITNEPDTCYSLVEKGSELDFFDGGHLHRLQVTWLAGVNDIKEAISAARIKEEFKIPTPVQTSCVINNQDQAKILVEHLIQSAQI